MGKVKRSLEDSYRLVRRELAGIAHAAKVYERFGGVFYEREAERHLLRLALAKLGIAWEDVEEVHHRILGPAAFLPGPGAVLMLLEEASGANTGRLAELRFDRRSRLGRRPPSPRALEAAARYLYVTDPRLVERGRRPRERIRVELWGLFGDHVLALYDLIAPRVRQERRTRREAPRDARELATFKAEACELAARLVDLFYGRALDRPLLRSHVVSRLQQRGRTAAVLPPPE